MSGASRVRVASSYYALVLEDTISYDFEVEADAMDYHNSEEAEYLADLKLLTPRLDACIEPLLRRCDGCILPYQEEPFYLTNIDTPYYSDLIEYGDSPLEQHYPILEASQRAVVIRGLVLSSFGGAGKYLNLELVTAGKLLASDLVKLTDTLESSVAELWIDEDYHVLSKPCDTKLDTNIEVTTPVEERIGFDDNPLPVPDGYAGRGDAEPAVGDNDPCSDDDLFGASPFE